MVGGEGWRPGIGFLTAYPASAALILALLSARIPRLLDGPALSLRGVRWAFPRRALARLAA